jgi:LL-diaminopimelate aminotransferase
MIRAKDEVRAARLRRLPTYLFEELAAIRRRKEADGLDVIDLSIGDPELGAPEVAIEALARYASDPALHRYTPHRVVESFNTAVCAWMKDRFGVDLDPSAEVYPLIGTKEGIAHLPLAVLDPGDLGLVPDPGYPVYSRGVWFAGGRVEWLPLDAENAFLPDTDRMAEGRPRLIYLNYPNNPTSAVTDLDFFRRAIEAAERTGAYVVSDAAYSEIAFDGYSSPSILEVPGGLERAVEFHSFSKTFSMAGWRVGFAAGNRRVIEALKTLKSNIDSGVFGGILMAAAETIRGGWDAHKAMLREYARRRSIVFDGLRDCGITYHESPATLYVWAKVPGEQRSMDFAKSLLEETGILVAPGAGFGVHGEGYFRISVTCPTEKVETAGRRLHEASKAWRSSGTWTR